MKLILSRKGFDSSPACGGCASPIFPDGQMISLPIPHPGGTITFGQLGHRGVDVGKVASDLTGKRKIVKQPAHLDPDLDPTARPRRNGWRPAFGQDSAAQRHLERQRVGVGDLFLFFGWFKRVEVVGGRYRYVPSAPDLHVIFGWLRVGEILRIGPDPLPLWMSDHPHAMRDCARHNTIYVAAGSDGGVFQQFAPCLQLTDVTSKGRSVWRLPADFLPGSRRPLTYHGDASRWTGGADHCRLQSVGKGQEFVVNLAEYPGVQRWAEELVRRRAGP